MNTLSKPKKKKPGRPRQPEPSSFLFEIKDWEPSYILSINHDRFFGGPYREYMHIDFDALCLRPVKYQGQIIRFTFAGERDRLELEISKRNSDWRPICIGSLELQKEGGAFYASVPHDSMGFLMDAIARGMLRFVHLWGGQLKRGKCLNTSLTMMKSVNPDDY